MVRDKNKTMPERRKKVFIDKNFQTRFIIKFCLIVCAASALTALLIYALNRGTTTVSFDSLRVVVKSTADFILPITIEILAIVTCMTAVATILVTLRASHKISGPVYKMSVELAKIKSRDLSSPIRIRAKDQLKTVVREFEEMRSAYNATIVALKRDWTVMRGPVGRAIDRVYELHAREEIEQAMERISNELSRYKTEP